MRTRPSGPAARRFPLLAALLAVSTLAGCGTNAAETVTEQAPATRSDPADRNRERGTDEQAAQPAPATTPTAREPSKDKSAGRWTSCDVDVDAWAPRTSCAFARNVFYEYWVAGQTSLVMVYDPALSRALRTRCRAGVARVICATADGGRVRIPVVALEMYSDDLAADYAASHDTGTDSTSALGRESDLQ